MQLFVLSASVTEGGPQIRPKEGINASVWTLLSRRIRSVGQFGAAVGARTWRNCGYNSASLSKFPELNKG